MLRITGLLERSRGPARTFDVSDLYSMVAPTIWNQFWVDSIKSEHYGLLSVTMGYYQLLSVAVGKIARAPTDGMNDFKDLILSLVYKKPQRKSRSSQKKTF